MPESRNLANQPTTLSRSGVRSRDPIICNPLDLPLAYSDLTVRGIGRVVWREGADPSLVRFRDRYYLFVSMSGGFWHSDDLAAWQFVATPDLPVLDYAPDIREVDGALVFSASKRESSCSFWRTTDPLAGFEEIPGTFAFWDPCLFQDDDGRVYLFWGCAHDQPLHGVELDRATFQPLGDPVDLFAGDHERHGWEWRAETDGSATAESVTAASGADPRPWMEGAWMTKHAGTFYLQYAAPATETNTYADGYYTSSAPLGPYTYSPHNPFSSVPGGFVPGAGHGSTVQDRFGNWWHAATSRISVHHVFERRVCLYPAGFDADGVLFCNQSFADHPIHVPQRLADPWTDVPTGWRLLSSGRPVTSTSTLDGRDPRAVVDEDIRTWWVAAEDDDEPVVTVDLGDGCTVRAVQVNLADHDVAAYKPAPDSPDPDAVVVRILESLNEPVTYVVDVSDDGTAWRRVGGSDGADSPHRLIVVEEPTQARYVRVVGGAGPWGAPFAMSGVRVFGVRSGSAPPASTVVATRSDDRTAHISWTLTPEADGFDVRYGLSPDHLYHSWLVRGRSDLVLSTLTAGENYWVAVDSFNGSGVTRGRAVPLSARLTTGTDQ